VRTYNIAAIPGDGIGKEVIAAGLEVLLACAERDGRFTLNVTRFDWGSERYKKMGALMPNDGVEALKQFDAILFGAVGASDVPDDVTLWGLRLAICQSLDQYANVRPARVLNGIQSPLRAARPQDIDWVIVRENSEGERGRADDRTAALPGRLRRRLLFSPVRACKGLCVLRSRWRDRDRVSC
jgi:tartrate dehydrogenase/decarboxylase / D-malate dehydrogenase